MFGQGFRSLFSLKKTNKQKHGMWNYVLYTDQTNVEMFGKKQTAYQHKRPIPAIKAQDLGTLQALIQP